MTKVILILVVLTSCTQHHKKENICVDVTKADFVFKNNITIFTIEKCDGDIATWRVKTPPKDKGVFL